MSEQNFYQSTRTTVLSVYFYWTCVFLFFIYFIWPIVNNIFKNIDQFDRSIWRLKVMNVIILICNSSLMKTVIFYYWHEWPSYSNPHSAKELSWRYVLTQTLSHCPRHRGRHTLTFTWSIYRINLQTSAGWDCMLWCWKHHHKCHRFLFTLDSPPLSHCPLHLWWSDIHCICLKWQKMWIVYLVDF